MSIIMDFLDKNKDWLFGGIGVAALSGIGTIFMRSFGRKRDVDHGGVVQTQKSGAFSTNAQVGKVVISEKPQSDV